MHTISILPMHYHRNQSVFCALITYSNLRKSHSSASIIACQSDALAPTTQLNVFVIVIVARANPNPSTQNRQHVEEDEKSSSSARRDLLDPLD